MVEWITSPGLTGDDDACREMEARAEAIARGAADEAIWLVEHPPLYTAGPQADPADLKAPDRFPVHRTRRGGQYSYHGPGQRPGRVGVWVVRDDKPLTPAGPPQEDKIAAIGIKMRKWVSFHGLSINVEPDLEHFSGIVPCGIAEHGVTSLVDLGLPVTMGDVDVALKRTFPEIFACPPEE